MKTYLTLFLFIIAFHVNAQLPVDKFASENLFLKSDSTFYYCAGESCSGSLVTKGKWTVQGDILTLACYDSIDCIPSVKITELTTRIEDSFISLSYNFGSLNYVLQPNDSNFSCNIFCNNKEFYSKGYGQFINGLSTYFPAGKCQKIFFSFEWPFDENKGFPISGVNDILIETDYPPSMLRREVDYYSFGTCSYVIRQDGLYSRAGDIEIYFNKR